MKYSYFILILILTIIEVSAQNEIEYEEYEQYEIYDPKNDFSLEGQIQYISELLDISGYVINSIIVYQTLPNKARVFQVDLDENGSGFIFVRWDMDKKENYVANKLIDPGLYYNLNSANEIKREQTEKKSFGIDDISIQANDQEKISEQDIKILREEYLKNREEVK